MKSLRWRITLSYAALFVVVLGFASFAISSAFRSLLVTQATTRIKQTAADIQRAAVPGGPTLGIFDVDPEAVLSDPRNLSTWETPTTVVQTDTANGYPLGKSQRTGNFFFLPNRSLSVDQPSEIIVEHSPLGDLLVLDQAIVSNQGKIVGIAHIGEELSYVDALLSRARNILFVVTIAAIVCVFGASYLVARGAIDPINRLSSAIEEIGSDRLDQRVAWTRDDEVGRLAATFDRLLDRLQDAFARERQFISDASHELKTPLTVINANAQMLKRWGDRDATIRSDSLDAIIGESGALAAMVNGMLLLAKADAGDNIPKAPLDLSRVVREALELVRNKATQKGLELSYIGPVGGGAIVHGEENLLRQLFTNLIDNAVKFTEEGGVAVSLRVEDGTVIGDVADTGIGIDEESIGRVFDRFFRTDKSRNRAVEGTGLGLAIVRSIVRVHEGEVEAARRPEGGTIFTVRLRTDPLIIESS